MGLIFFFWKTLNLNFYNSDIFSQTSTRKQKNDNINGYWHLIPFQNSSSMIIIQVFNSKIIIQNFNSMIVYS